MASPFASSGSSGGSSPFSSGGSIKVGPPPRKGGGGVLGAIGHVAAAPVHLVGNLAKDVGATAVGVVPGAVHAGAAFVHEGEALAKHPIRWVNNPNYNAPDFQQLVTETGQQYKDYYGHDVLHHIYSHPLQPVLDALTVASLGAGGATKLGLLSDERAALVTRSPRAIATGKGPVHTDVSSPRAFLRGREKLAAAARAKRPEGVLGVGGEVKHYGKQLKATAAQHALENLAPYAPYVKATNHLTDNEWTALNIRARGVHPDDLKALWKGTPLERTINDPKVVRLVLSPSKKMLVAEPAAETLSKEGAALLQSKGRLTTETAAARPDLTRRQASEQLGREVKPIPGGPTPYYVPDIKEPLSGSPLSLVGGGKGVPRLPGSTKQNLGVLTLHGKLHLRSDVLGPEFLRRVKYVKYDEIHNGLVRGAVRVTPQEINAHFGGKLPKGWEYVREKASTRVPFTLRGEGEKRIPINELIPNPEDLHDSQLARDGFSTTDQAQAHSSGGKYYIVPTSTVKAATGEYSRSNQFTRAFVAKPLKVWRSVILGLRVGFLTNNLVGNSIMYAAKTGGDGALRNLFQVIMETHGKTVARKVLDNAATPPKLRADLTKEFFPEQIQGTFGRTQSPATSPAHIAGRATVEAGRKVTGALPKLTSKVAEEYPRRALVRYYIKNSPEFKQVYRSLPKQTRSFEAAARQVLEGKGGAAYQRYISKQVNQALGDYMHLSAAERNVLRNILPFYSWYRAIVTTTYHLAADTPLRANALGLIGRIGKEASDNALGQVPSFLQGAIPLGNGPQGTKRVLSTQGMNPYGTLAQLQRGGTTDITSLGLNPFVEGPIQYLQRHTGNVSPGALAASPLVDLLKNLPPSTLAFPPGPSKLYPTKSRKTQILGNLGVPVKEYNPAVAARQAKQGR